MKTFTACAAALFCASNLSAAPETNPVTSPSHSDATHAQAGHADHRELEQILISVPIHRQISETALPITLIDGERLRGLATSTIGDTLASTPGLANASFGPGVGQPVIRGQQGPRVAVLQNSTRSADASNISADHAVSVEPLLADSIEVLRGPATLLYGGGAIGGVVNVIDNRIPRARAEQTTGGLEYRHESAADLDAGVFRLDTGADNLALHISGLYRESNNLDIPGESVDPAAFVGLDAEDIEEIESTRGYIDNTNTRSDMFTAGGSLFFDTGYVGLAVSSLNNNYGIPGAGHAHHEEEGGAEEEEEEEGGIRLDVEQTRYDARLHLDDPLRGIHRFDWQLTYSDYKHDEIEGNGEVGTSFSNESWESRLDIAHEDIAGWHGVIGLQLRDGEFSAIGEESFIPVTETTSTGLFIVEGYDRGDWTYELGLRIDYDELNPEGGSGESFTSVSGSASALWNISSAWQVSIALSNAERAPVIEELFSNLGATDEFVVHAATQSIERGNTGLKTEKSRNIDVKTRWQQDTFNLTAGLFYNDFDDYIYLQNTGLEQDEISILDYEQQGAKLYGVELEAGIALVDNSDYRLDLELVADSIRAELNDGNDVPRIPPQRIAATLRYSMDSWSAFVGVTDAAKQNKPGSNETETAAYTRWDLGVDYRLLDNQLTLFLKGNNITDEEIRASTSFLRNFAPEAGRSVISGLRYTF